MKTEQGARRALEGLITRVVAPRWGAWLIVCALMTAASIGVLATRWNMNSDLNALLPDDAPASIATREAEARLGSSSSLYVVIDSPDFAASLAFAEKMASALRADPRIALAHYHNDRAFFEEHALLYMPVAEIESITERVRSTIKQKKREANPFFVSLKKAEPAPPLDLEAEARSRAEIAPGANQYKEYLRSEDGFALVIVVRFATASSDMLGTNAMLAEVRQLAEGLDPASFHPRMGVEFTGALVKRKSQYAKIVDDIVTSAGFTLAGLFLVLGIYFRRPRAVLVVLTPLVCSVLWTLAGAILIFGELNVITVFIFTILLGLGIDFGIHTLHAFDRGRAAGMGEVRALAEGARTTGLATSVGALTTLTTFAILATANFKSLSQFGVVAAIGVLLSLVGTLVLLPALVLGLHRARPLPPPPPHHAERQQARAALSRRAGVWVAAGLSIAAALTLLWAPQVGSITFEENFGRIGSWRLPWEREVALEVREREFITRRQASDIARQVARRAEEARRDISPETYRPERKQTSTRAQSSSAVGTSFSSAPTALLFDDPAKARAAAERARARWENGRRTSVSSVRSIYDFLPGDEPTQRARLAAIEALREAVAEIPDRLLSEKERADLERARPKLELRRPIGLADLPDWTKRLFREAGPAGKPASAGEPFAYEYVVLVAPRYSQTVGARARLYIDELTDLVGAPEASGYRLASQATVYTTMLDEVRVEGGRLMLIALGAVFVIIAVAFRSLGGAALSMAPLFFGGLWTFGICGALGIGINFFNMTVLPALVGIGVDDGVHVYARWRELGTGSVGRVTRDVGSAVLMTSITSLIGFGGLAITDYKGLVSIGQLAIVGIVCAFVATITVLPPLLWLIDRRRASREP